MDEYSDRLRKFELQVKHHGKWIGVTDTSTHEEAEEAYADRWASDFPEHRILNRH